MLLLITVLNKCDEVKSFSFPFFKLEFGLDFLSFISTKGDTILTANLVDEEKVIELPVSVFDGAPFSGPIGQLENQWKELLGLVPNSIASKPKPTRSKPKSNKPKLVLNETTKELIAFSCQQLQSNDRLLAQLDLMISRIEDLMSRVNETSHDDCKRSASVDRYTRLISDFQQQIDRTRTRQQWFLKRLKQLQHN